MELRNEVLHLWSLATWPRVSTEDSSCAGENPGVSLPASKAMVKFVAAIGDLEENDDLDMSSGEGEENSVAVLELPPRDQPPSVPIRKEKRKRHPGNPRKE